MDEQPASAGQADLSQLVAAAETNLLGGDRKYTRFDVAEQSGLTADEVRTLWRALRFASVGTRTGFSPTQTSPRSSRWASSVTSPRSTTRSSAR